MPSATRGLTAIGDPVAKAQATAGIVCPFPAGSAGCSCGDPRQHGNAEKAHQITADHRAFTGERADPGPPEVPRYRGKPDAQQIPSTPWRRTELASLSAAAP